MTARCSPRPETQTWPFCCDTFKVYALDRGLDVQPGLDKAALVKAMEGRILAWGELVGTYWR